MNQVLKEAVYGKGTQRQIDFVKEIGGMTEEESKLFQLIHEGKDDLFIQQELGMTRKSREHIERSVRDKVLIAVMCCLNHCMEYEQDYKKKIK